MAASTCALLLLLPAFLCLQGASAAHLHRSARQVGASCNISALEAWKLEWEGLGLQSLQLDTVVSEGRLPALCRRMQSLLDRSQALLSCSRAQTDQRILQGLQELLRAECDQADLLQELQGLGVDPCLIGNAPAVQHCVSTFRQQVRAHAATISASSTHQNNIYFNSLCCSIEKYLLCIRDSGSQSCDAEGKSRVTLLAAKIGSVIYDPICRHVQQACQQSEVTNGQT